MTKHIGFDIETLDITPRAVVLSLACVSFSFEETKSYDEYKKEGLYIKLNPIEQMKAGRSVGPDTVKWWKSQGPIAAKILQPSAQDVSVLDTLRLVKEYIFSHGYDYKESYIWTRGLNFDIPIIEDLYRTNGQEQPYNTWKTRDIRTYIDVLTGSTSGKYELVESVADEFVAHSALDDIVMDIMRMKEIYTKVYGG
jgi:hypothetical protein